jgi:alanine dehydrogenase
MSIAVLREVKPREGRVALSPTACGTLVQRGHTVWVEAGAGQGAGFTDADYQARGATVVPRAEAFQRATHLVKVKEPIADDLQYVRSDHILFCFLHLAAEPELTRQLQGIGATAIGFETLAEHGGLPLLAPMSEVAGRLAIHLGTNLLHFAHGGRGVMLGGVNGAERGRVVIVGCGNAGGAALEAAVATGSEVVGLDVDRAKLAAMRRLGPNVTTLAAEPDAVAEATRRADLVVGAVLRTGQRAPHVITESMVVDMPSGSAIVDLAIDQGGCVATIRPTNYDAPTFRVHDVTHFGVTNMPGAVPRTASQALSSVLLPYVVRLLEVGLDDPALAGAVNIRDGVVVYPGLAPDAVGSSGSD